MENQGDELSVMDNESVFVETQMNAVQNIGQKAAMSEMRTQQAATKNNVTAPFGIE